MAKKRLYIHGCEPRTICAVCFYGRAVADLKKCKMCKELACADCYMTDGPWKGRCWCCTPDEEPSATPCTCEACGSAVDSVSGCEECGNIVCDKCLGGKLPYGHPSRDLTLCERCSKDQT